MTVFARNAIAFLVAIAIYIGGLRVAGFIFDLLHLEWGLVALLAFHFAFGVAGYFLFRGNSRAVLVLFASITYGVTLAVVKPDPRHVQLFVSISFGVLAAMATSLTSWVVERVTRTDSKPAVGVAKEANRPEGRDSTLAYRVGKWIGDRLQRSSRDN